MKLQYVNDVGVTAEMRGAESHGYQDNGNSNFPDADSNGTVSPSMVDRPVITKQFKVDWWSQAGYFKQKGCNALRLTLIDPVHASATIILGFFLAVEYQEAFQWKQARV